MIHYSGTLAWYLKGKRHRTDGPAIERINGMREWWYMGEKHREDGPAIYFENGTNPMERWYRNGQLHRIDGPANIFKDGSRRLWYKDGRKHRPDGPAVEYNYNNVKYPFTTDCWYLEGRRVGPYEVLGDTPEAFAWVMKYGR